MKKLTFIFLLLILVSCKTQNKYSDFDYSYSRSGGFAPIYENLLIKGNNVHYSFEGQNKKFEKDFELSNDELQELLVSRMQHARDIEAERKVLEDEIAEIQMVLSDRQVMVAA